jgi:two-component system, response regulator PdtaR
MAQIKRLNPATILVVEDDALVQLELADWLADLGLTVLTADNADQAIERLDSHPQIDLLLTDIRMPGTMDGIRLAHHVAERWPPVKIVVLSGLFRTPLCELPPNSLFVPKPYRPEELWRALAPKQSRTARQRGVGAAVG